MFFNKRKEKAKIRLNANLLKRKVSADYTGKCSLIDLIVYDDMTIDIIDVDTKLKATTKK